MVLFVVVSAALQIQELVVKMALVISMTANMVDVVLRAVAAIRVVVAAAAERAIVSVVLAFVGVKRRSVCRLR